MAAPVVFDNVSKKFRRGERHDSLRDLVPAIVRAALRRRSPEVLGDQEFWALRNVSFEVQPGEALGIIGPNGAGKSTTLKVLTKILRPTSGRAEVRGRIGALIEVAAGFHPDLTGRENIFLQGAIMGMKRAEIARRFDEIVEFAGVGEFVDTPVKRYSSGMNARLGFAIAAHLDPTVLIIDEVLAVGDMAFQQRCIARMMDFKRQGVAMLFVSHNLAAVTELCQRTVFLSGGGVAFSGPTPEAVEAYLNSGFSGTADDPTSSHFSEVALTDLQGRQVATCEPGTRLRIAAKAVFREAARDVTFALVVHQASTGIYAYGANSGSLGLRPMSVQVGDTVDLTFEFSANLTRGLYMLELHAATAATMTIHARSCPAAWLRIEEDVSARGIADLDARCTVREHADKWQPV